MAYTKTTWKNRVVQNPNTYLQQQNADGTVTLVPKEGTVTEAGTPVNAVNMNHIEDGIASVDTNLGDINDSALDASVKGKSLTNMIKVLFQNVNNGKNSVYSAIVDKGTTPASKDFADLVAGISAINTGKKWASGTTSAGSQTSFEYADGSDTGSAYPLKLPITFEPSLVLAVSHVASYYVAVYSNIYDGYYSKTAKVIQYIGSSHDEMVANYKGDVSPAGLTSGGFTIPVIGSSWVYNWIAIE